MLLQQLKLHNIRSYLDEIINFPEGSSLLSGDIGSGKSTILLAVEFALFGTSRTELPGEALLRKGAAQGGVELTFSLGDKNISIKRGIKKVKQAVVQTTGYVIINNIKKELTPVEMKAEIISLLGYPEEFLSQTKNYLFRYTVYTPQEEMKEILQENEEIRLDTLRKIFQIDKYRVIRENLQFYLKQMRTQMAILNTRLEPFEEVKARADSLNKEKEELAQSLQQREPRLEELKARAEQAQKELEKTEEEQRLFLQLRQEMQTMMLLLEEKGFQERGLAEQKKKIEEELSGLSLPEGKAREDIEKGKRELEGQKNSIMAERTRLQENIAYLARLIAGEEKEKQKFHAGISQLPVKEEKVNQLIQELAQLEKENLPEKKIQLEESFNTASAAIASNEMLLAQSKEVRAKMLRLDTCPTCRQEVSCQHKEKIMQDEERTTTQVEAQLFELYRQRSQLLEQRKKVEKKLQEKVGEESLLLRFRLELEQMQGKLKERKEKEEQLSAWLKEKNDAGKRLNELERENKVKLIEDKLLRFQELLNSFLKKEYLEKQRENIIKLGKENREQTAELNLQSRYLEQQLASRKNLNEEIIRAKSQLIQFREEERVLAIEQAELAVKKREITKQLESLQEQLVQLSREKEKLIQYRELYHWLDEHFLKLSYTIEKHVMVNIHRLFSQLFQEWFALLIDDENIYSQLDDSFYPLIEQNGYEISFSSLSGGEKTSASLAYRLALNRVINDVVHEVRTKDLLILDEPTDGFSSEQLDKVKDVLETLDLRQIIIVSHESQIESFVENVIRIGKKGHVSRVVS